MNTSSTYHFLGIGNVWVPKNADQVLFGEPSLMRIYYGDGIYVERRFIGRSPNGYYENHRVSKGEVYGSFRITGLAKAPAEVLLAALRKENLENVEDGTFDADDIDDPTGRVFDALRNFTGKMKPIPGLYSKKDAAAENDLNERLLDAAFATA